MGVGREGRGELCPLDFEIIGKKRLFFQFRGIKNKFHHFWPSPGKIFGKIPYCPSPGKIPSDAHGCRPSVWKRLQKNEKEKKRYLIDAQFSTDKKLATTQDRQTLQNSDEKQYCQYWIQRLVVFTRFPANRDCLLKLYMLVKSARTVSRELYWKKCIYIGLASYG